MERERKAEGTPEWLDIESEIDESAFYDMEGNTLVLALSSGVAVVFAEGDDNARLEYSDYGVPLTSQFAFPIDNPHIDLHPVLVFQEFSDAGAEA